MEDQVPRLRQFKTAHPDVHIGTRGPKHNNVWQAQWTDDQDDEVIVTRLHLVDLIDVLEIRFPASENAEGPA